MTRIQQTFNTLKQQQRKALIPYITAGDPDLNTTLALLHTLVDAGADIIELGVPFSEPVADGSVIQQAHTRALANQVSLEDIFKLVREFRQQNQHTPLVLMGYVNPIEIYGYQRFVEACKQAGVDGALTVDLPVEEDTDFFTQLQQQEIAPIVLVTPTTTPERIAKIVQAGSGFLYYVSVKGVTGKSHLDIESIKEKTTQLKQLTDLPIAIGFGIRDATTATQVAPCADAVVIGSALVALIADKAASDRLMDDVKRFIQSIRGALDS